MADLPKELTEKPEITGRAGNDVLSQVLRAVRLTGSLQFCFSPSGIWQTDGRPSLAGLSRGTSGTMPFHIVVEGSCWLKMRDIEVVLKAGDVAIFPFGTGHQLGSGAEGRLVTPVADLPPKPWREVPVLRYGDDGERVRLLCGYLSCDALNFAPLRHSLPELLHVSASDAGETAWLRATIAQIITEADVPRSGGLSMLERLTEIAFIELLRQQILTTTAGARGWLAALADPALARCLAMIHGDALRDWSVADLSAGCGLSRSVLTERFEAILDTSPMRYVRDWRLYLASIALGTSDRSIATVAHEAGYGTEAAFSRAFSRSYGLPPATWRQQVQSKPQV